MLSKNYAKNGKTCKVTFALSAEAAGDARSVSLVGDFNDWQHEATRLKHVAEGGWEVTLSLDAGKEYHFRYLIDGGRWENDWNADKYSPSPFGGVENSVVIV